jgi:hypothetical protein
LVHAPWSFLVLDGGHDHGMALGADNQGAAVLQFLHNVFVIDPRLTTGQIIGHRAHGERAASGIDPLSV